MPPRFPLFIMLNDKDAKTPLYRQIYAAIRGGILRGEFQPTLPLPASRALAEQLGVARTTVINAYEQLLAEGYLESRVGAGTFVAAHLPEEYLQTQRAAERRSGKSIIAAPQTQPAVPRRLKLAPFGKLLAQRGAYIRRNYGAGALVPFRHGIPALKDFPLATWAKITQQQRHATPAMLGYGDSLGYAPLRAAIAAHLAAARGVRCDPGQVIITNGTQQALDLIGRILLEPGAEVVLEDPCYLGARDSFAATGARLVPIAVDMEGFDVATARRKSRAPRAIYVTPSHQYPLGVTMTLARRLKLLEWARATGALIIEDDYNSEYRYAGRPLAALQGLDRDGRVLYLGTFSKTIFPALRLGCLVVPPDLIELFAAARALSDLHSPVLDQAVLAEFIAEGHFARHLRRMRAIYQARRQCLLAEAQKHLAGQIEITPAASGMHLVGWLPAGYDDRSVAGRAAEHKLRVAPLSAYCFAQKLPAALLLGYTAFDEKQIRAGVKRLARVIEYSVPVGAKDCVTD